MAIPVPFDGSESGAIVHGTKMKIFRLDQSEHTIQVELGKRYVLKNGLSARAERWTNSGVLMTLISEHCYLSGRGLTVAAFDCGDGDIFGLDPEQGD